MHITRLVAIGYVVLALGTPLLAQESSGVLQVTCEPGVRVYVDELFAGLTTVDEDGLYIQDAPSGHHIVRLEKRGCLPQEFGVEIDADRPMEVKAGVFLAESEAALPKPPAAGIPPASAGIATPDRPKPLEPPFYTVAVGGAFGQPVGEFAERLRNAELDINMKVANTGYSVRAELGYTPVEPITAFGTGGLMGFASSETIRSGSFSAIVDATWSVKSLMGGLRYTEPKGAWAGSTYWGAVGFANAELRIVATSVGISQSLGGSWGLAYEVGTGWYIPVGPSAWVRPEASYFYHKITDDSGDQGRTVSVLRLGMSLQFDFTGTPATPPSVGSM